MSTITNPTYQSRFGYHPCTRETCLKLKEAHLLLLKAFRDIRAYQRWERKQEPVGEAPEYPSFVAEHSYYKRSPEGETKYGLTIGTNAWKSNWSNVRVHYYGHVLEQYRKARRPKSTPEEVEVLDLPEDIWKVVEMLKGFYDINHEAA